MGQGEAYDTSFTREDSLSLQVDCTAPGTAIAAGPLGATNDPTPRFEFNATGGASGFECSVDSAEFASCSSPYTVAGALADGAHTFEVRARDQAGNVDASPAARSFVVDTEAPETAITGGPAPRIASTSAVFAFGTSGGARFECAIDGETFARCSSPARYTGLAEGPHEFRVRAVDEAGNADGSPALREFAVDRSVLRPRLAVRSPQDFDRRLRLKVEAHLGEPGRVAAWARVDLSNRPVKTRKSRLKVSPGEGSRAVVTANRLLDRKLRRAVGGGPVQATVICRFTDALGNTRTEEEEIVIRDG